MRGIALRCRLVIVILAIASQDAGSAAGMTALSHRLCCCHRWSRCTQRLYNAALCGKSRPDVAVRWIARSRLIRRPSGQRWARPKFILFEDGGKFMNFSVRRASMSGCRRIQRRHSFLPFFCCRKKGSTSVAQRARKPFAAACHPWRRCTQRLYNAALQKSPPGRCSPSGGAFPPYPPPVRPALGAAKIHTV